MKYRFQCQKSGNCCQSRGEYGYVYLTPQDVIRLANHLGMTPIKFFEEYCTEDTEGNCHLKELGDCQFLKDHQCSVYDGRPTQCRTWPFWPENLPAKKWKELGKFCPGVNVGPEVSEAVVMGNATAFEGVFQAEGD